MKKIIVSLFVVIFCSTLAQAQHQENLGIISLKTKVAVKTIKEEGERKKVFYTFSAEDVVTGKEINFSTKNRKFARKIIKLSLKEPVVLQGSETEPLLSGNGATEFYIISGYLKSSEYKIRYEKKKAVKEIDKPKAAPVVKKDNNTEEKKTTTPPFTCPQGKKWVEKTPGVWECQ